MSVFQQRFSTISPEEVLGGDVFCKKKKKKNTLFVKVV